MASKTVKILSLDGGGIRGYLSATALKRFCVDALITPTELPNAFDIITGTSIGGIQALGYAYGQSPQMMLQFFADKGSSIFSYSSILPLSAYKFSCIMGLPSYPASFYGQEPLRAALESVFGTTLTLADLPAKVLIPSWDGTAHKPVIFSNITGYEPLLTGANEKVVDVALATSAAPLYFPSIAVAEQTMIDGGVFLNNPSTLAYSVSRQLFPSSSRFCLLSIGTGFDYTDFALQKRLTSSFHPSLVQEVEGRLLEMRAELLPKYPEHAEQVIQLTSLGSIAPYNVEYLFYLLNNVFIAGPQQLNANIMSFETNDIFNDVFSYRFQYSFQEGEDASIDNASPENLAKLAQYANTQYDADILQIRTFIDHFNAV